MFLLMACSAQPPRPTPTLLSTAPLFVPLSTDMPTLTFTPPPTRQIINTLVPSPADLAPYEQYSIEYLRERSYGGGVLEIVEVLKESEKFTAYTVRYQSDGLFIYAVMNVPNGDGLYPVVISVHGYFHPAEYYVLDTDFTIENTLAENGYITIHPTMRNYPPSDSGDNLFRVGDAVDVLNLIALVKLQTGNGILQKAAPNHIGLGGRSMGGGIALRVLTVTQDVKAAYLYSPTSGDEARTVDFFDCFTVDAQFKDEAGTPAEALAEMSPQIYYADITASILLAHGVSDRVVPVTWSEDTCNLLKSAGVNKRCIFYKGADHSFPPQDLEDFISEILSYFEAHLRQ
jgi:dipeptidyl aminopeptidase/acylaminoacyl peptidase